MRGSVAAERFYGEIMARYSGRQVVQSVNYLCEHWAQKYPCNNAENTLRECFANGFRAMAYIIAQQRMGQEVRAARAVEPVQLRLL